MVKPLFASFSMHQYCLGGLFEPQNAGFHTSGFWSVGPGWHLQIGISSKLSADVDCVGCRTTLWESLPCKVLRRKQRWPVILPPKDNEMFMCVLSDLFLIEKKSVCIYIHMLCVCVYTYIHIERETERKDTYVSF